MKLPIFGSSKPAPVAAAPPVDSGPPGATVVLLVDDEPAVRNLFALALRREGYHVIEASNGVEALNIAARLDHIDLVVTDVVMPMMKGPEFAAKLRERLPDMKFIFVSGYLLTDDLGPNAYPLAKPFMRQDLVKKVYDVVGPPAVVGT
ncbi:MAG: response regulator [Acidimicrobiia bacterium]|nr:response regulator [Acidimicrobiia bacterium]